MSSARRSAAANPLLAGLLVLLVALASTILSLNALSAQAAPNPAVSLRQWANVGGFWHSGNLNPSNSLYAEGDVVPFRAELTRLGGTVGRPETHTVTVEWDTQRSGAHAYDYITSVDHTETAVDPCAGLACPAGPTTLAIPADPGLPAGIPQAPGSFTLWGGTLIEATYVPAGDGQQAITVAFAATADAAVLAWGGHIASRIHWAPEPTAGDIAGSSYHMRVTDLSGRSPGNQDRSLSASAVTVPGISLAKTAEPTSAYVDEDTVTYTFVVTNTGETDLEQVTLTDDTLAGFAPAPFALAPGQARTLSHPYAPTAADLPGPLVNVASVAGTAPGGETVTATDSASVALLLRPSPGIALVKTGTLDGAALAGGTVTYLFEVTNSGNVPLSDVTLTDPRLGGALTVGEATLAPGASTTATAVYILTQADVDAGRVDNVATASGTPPGGVPVTASDDDTVRLDPTAALRVVKTAAAAGDAVGDPITYTFTVTNTGDVTLTDVSAVDSPLGPVGLDADTLAPGASTSGTLSHTITQADVDAGRVDNTVLASGTPPAGAPVTADDDATVSLPRRPAITVVKLANTDAARVGTTVGYTYTVENTGNVTLTDVTVDDDVLGAVALSTTTLAPGQQATGVADHPVVEADLPGPIINVARATGSAPDGSEVAASDRVSVDLLAAPALRVVKTAAAAGDAVGDPITYTFTVTNTGDVTLTDVSAVDSPLGPVGLDADTLAPGASTSGTLSHTITQADVDAGRVDNTVLASGTPPAGAPVTADDDATVSLPRRPAITVAKTASTDEATRGTTVTYTYTVENTGNVTLTDVTVDDDVIGRVSGEDGLDLAPGASVTVSADYVITAVDEANGLVTNVASATGRAPDGSEVAASDSVTVGVPLIEVLQTGTLSVTKTLSGGGAPADGASFGFTVACPGASLAADDAAFTLPGRGGTKVLRSPIPAGTACTVTETADGGAARTTVTTAAGAAVGSSATVTISGTVTTVTFDNRFDDEPAAGSPGGNPAGGTPDAEPVGGTPDDAPAVKAAGAHPPGDRSPASSALPRTGAAVLAQLLVGAGALSLGAWLVRRDRPGRRPGRRARHRRRARGLRG